MGMRACHFGIPDIIRSTDRGFFFHGCERVQAKYVGKDVEVAILSINQHKGSISDTKT